MAVRASGIAAFASDPAGVVVTVLGRGVPGCRPISGSGLTRATA